MKTRTWYTVLDLFTLLARLAKPATDALADERAAVRKLLTPAPAATFTPNPGRAVVGQGVDRVAATPVVPVEPAQFVPECAAAFSMPADGNIPSMAPWLDVAPIAAKPARKLAARTTAPTTTRTSTTPRRTPTSKRDATGTHGTLNWKAGQGEGACAGTAGTVVIKAGRTSCSYAVTETPTDWDGRAFRLDKLDAGSDPESRSYSVFVCRRGTAHRCDCKGFESGNGKPCKHVNAVKALAATARV